MLDKADDTLQGVNDFLRSLTDKITPNIVLLVALINGFIIGLVTTGYLGDSSISVKSGTFGLIIWQFVVICVFSTRYIDLSTSYLNKFALSGFVGYMWQWQFFGMLAQPEIKTISPPFDNNGAIIFIGYLSVLGLFYCFTGNSKKKAVKFTLKDKNAA